MSDVNQSYARLTLGGQEYDIALTLSVIDQFQERYGSLSKALEASHQYKEFAEMIRILINDSVAYHNAISAESWEEVSTTWVSHHITIHNLKTVNQTFLEAFGVSFPDGEGTSPKGETGQRLTSLSGSSGG